MGSKKKDLSDSEAMDVDVDATVAAAAKAEKKAKVSGGMRNCLRDATPRPFEAMIRRCGTARLQRWASARTAGTVSTPRMRVLSGRVIASARRTQYAHTLSSFFRSLESSR